VAAASARSKLAACALLCLALACHAAPESFPLQVPVSGAIPDGREVRGYAAAVDAIVRVMVQEFRTPAPRGQLLVYATGEEFEQGLVEHLKIKPALAKSTAKFAKSAVGSYNVLVNRPAILDAHWPDRIELLAHEITHSLQLTLADKPGIARPQWLMEGSAEWMAFQVTSALRLDDMTSVRARLTLKVREAKGRSPLPRLVGLDTFAQWVAARNRFGFDATYSQSFLVADYLIQRHSFDRVMDFFRRFEHSNDPAANFAVAFGESVDEFGRAVDAHLETLLN
jgi:hypothetical protein